jgi:hypothetical protein
MANTPSSRLRTQKYRDFLRQRGLRPVQLWVPDLRATGRIAEIQRQCQLVNQADQAESLMAWVEDVSIFDNESPG